MLTHPLSHIFPPFLNEFYPLSKFQLCNTVLSTLVPRLYVRPSELLQLFFFFFFFLLCPCFFFFCFWMFWGQGSNVSHSSDNARSSTCWATRELPELIHESLYILPISPHSLQLSSTWQPLFYSLNSVISIFFFPIPHKNESIPYFSLSRWYLTRTQSSPASSTLL